MSTILILKNVKTIFTGGMFEASSFKDGDGAPRYTGTFIIPKDSANDKLVLAAINEEGKETFGKTWEAKWTEWAFNKSNCFYTRGDVRNQEYCHGHHVIAAHRYEDKGAPAIVDKQKNPVTAASGIIYGGCDVNLKFEIWGQTKNYPGVRATLIAVQFAADGEPLSGSGPANADGFDDLSTDDDLMGGL